MRIDLDHLRVFYAVAQTGSFSAAAEILHISQPAVSRTMTLLEERLETILFERHARGVRLTPEGERLYRFACKVVQEVTIIEKLIRDNSKVAEGELKLVTTPHMGASWLMSYLKDFLRENDKMKITLMLKDDKIDVSEADAAIRTFVPHHPHLIQRKLASFPMKLYASPSYIAEFGMPEKPSDLNNHKLITYASNEVNAYGNIDWILNVGASYESIREPYLQVSSLEGITNAAKEGIGIAELSPKWPNVINSDLVQVLPHLEGPVVDLYYIYPPHSANSKRITALADYLERVLAE